MKTERMKKAFKNNWVFVLMVFILSAGIMSAQEDETASKKKVRISLDYTNTNNIGARLVATVKSKVDKVYENIPNVKVNFYLDEIKESAWLGETITNSKGEAIFIPPETKHGDIQFLYLATIEDDEHYEDNDAEIEVEKSFVELKLEEEDSIRTVYFFVGRPDSIGNITPEEEVEVMIYVKRLFGLLPLMEETEITDEEGMIALEFPSDIRGDEDGMVSIVAKVDEHETFGRLTAVKKIGWGIPLKPDDKINDRELWSARSNAPMSLIVIINAMLIGIWGVIFYVIFQLFKIKKIGTEKTVR